MFLNFGVFQRGHREDAQKRAEKIMESCPRYEIDVTFYPEEQSFTAHQNIIITNDKSTEFEELYFHLYPNAFKSFDDAPFPRGEMERAYPEGFLPGYLSVKKIFIDSAEANYEIEGTFLKVILSKPFKPKDKLVMTVEFDAVLPPACGRFGYGKNTFNIGNWYPILATYDDKGWHKEPYYDVGDPFYSEVGIYDVHISAPKDYIIAASGSLQEKREKADQIVWNFKTDLVRDFAWVASNKFRTVNLNIGKTRITSYYLEGDEDYGQEALEYAQKALVFFNNYFGEYPYSDYSVVASDFYIGGMEYPNLVIIGEEFYRPGDFLEYVIVHETAHQWWYGLVGNNQVMEAWLDEALAEYSTILYYENIHGKKTGKRVYEVTILNPYKLYEAGNIHRPVLRHLSEFNDWRDYSATVYYKGAIMLKYLEARIGKAKLREALCYYFGENLYKNASTIDFIKAINYVTGVDWTDYIYRWLKGSETLKNAA